MDKSHKQVITTNPVAIKQGQGRLHVADEHPWHRKTELVKCPKCEIVFIMTGNFPKEQLLATLEKQHQNQEGHPDYIPSEPDFTHVEDCDCQKDSGASGFLVKAPKGGSALGRGRQNTSALRKPRNTKNLRPS